jgi:hypothetical protein
MEFSRHCEEPQATKQSRAALVAGLLRFARNDEKWNHGFRISFCTRQFSNSAV